MGASIKGLQNIKKRLGRLMTNTGSLAKDVLINVAEKTIDYIKEATPSPATSDTATGALQNAWRYGAVVVKQGEDYSNMPVYAEQGIVKIGNKYHLNIVNGMRYASFVNYGQGTGLRVAHHMLEIGLWRAEREFPEVAERFITEYWNEAMKS